MAKLAIGEKVVTSVTEKVRDPELTPDCRRPGEGGPGALPLGRLVRGVHVCKVSRKLSTKLSARTQRREGRGHCTSGDERPTDLADSG